MPLPSFTAPLKALLIMAGSYLFVLLVAGLLSPFVYAWISPYIPSDFDRYFDRLRYVGLLFLLPVWWKAAGVRWHTLGWNDLRGGFFLALLGVVCVLLTGLVSGVLAGNFDPAQAGEVRWKILAGLVMKGIGVGVIVSLIEEIVFRGILQRIAIRGFGVKVGIWVGALFFAWLHGRPPMDWYSLQIGIMDGLRMAWSYLTVMPDNLTFTELMNLALLGGVLGMLYQKSGSLWLPIGFHAGIVAGVVFAGEFMRGLGVIPPAEALVELPSTTVLLSAWVVGVVVWPGRLKDASGDTLAGIPTKR